MSTETTLDAPPVLYKRTRTGALQYYKIEARPMLEGAQIRKESGQIGTPNPVVHIEAIHEGKNLGRANATTPMEQAQLQIASDIRRKKDEGYKSLEDLNQIVVGPTPEAYSRPATKKIYDDILIEVLGRILPTYNSDANRAVKPMLAQPVRWAKVTYPCYCQPKLDGVRCLMVVGHLEDGTSYVTFLSRSGKEYTTLNHIKADVLAYAYSWLPDPFILDGELFSDEISFQEITQAVKKQYPNSLKLKFRAYDIVNDDNQEVRLHDTKALVERINSVNVEYVSAYYVSSRMEVQGLHDGWVQKGYEGAMIRLKTGHYAQGQRSGDLLKVKTFEEDEFQFDRWEFGQRREDLIAVVYIGQKGTPGYREFRAKMQGSTAQKEALYKEWTGKTGLFTVKFFGWTDDGNLRFPVAKGFRMKEDMS